MRFNVCVNHGSTFELRTTLTDDALGAKAAAEAGSNWGGIGRNIWELKNRVSNDDLQ
jgi:hypothetical protein